MSKFVKYIQGIALGAGAILPGISSGVMCVVFGIYEKLLNSVLKFFDDWKKNLSYLLPIALGTFTGIILFGNILKYLFNTYYIPTCFAFIGLILGSISSISKQSKADKITICHVLCLTLTLSFSIYLFLIEKSSNNIENLYYENLPIFYLIASGFFMSAGVVIPGVSSSVILMILKTYPVYLDAVSTLNLSILIPMGIGLIIGGLLFLKITQFLLEKFKSYTYFAIIGFVIGSIPVLYPGFEFNITGFISILLFIICFFISKLLDRIENSK